MPRISHYDAFHADDYVDVVDAARSRFANRIKQICGDANVRLLIMPAKADTTTTTDLSANARTVTWDATIAARLSQKGLGYDQTYNGTSQVGLIADAANLSFGNGTVDTPFTVVALANVTDTANYRDMLAKDSTINGAEWWFEITNTDKLALNLRDNSAAVTSNRTSDAVITQGSLHLFACVYTAATGGATAGNDITLYEDAGVIASTASNNASYVSMDNTSAPVVVGAIQTGTYDQWFPGTMPMVLLVGAALSGAQLTSIKTAVNEFYGLAL